MIKLDKQKQKIENSFQSLNHFSVSEPEKVYQPGQIRQETSNTNFSMLMPSKRVSICKGSEIFLSKKHIITEEDLSELCSESKYSQSSNLLQLATRSKHKLKTVTKRTNQPDNTIQGTKNFQQPHVPIQSHKSNKQNNTNDNKNDHEQEMNSLYEENQKLGYRINYLNDENNFYRISINNIEKLNSNIHKQLDGQETNTGIKNKINTKSVSVSTHYNLNSNNGKISHKLTLDNAKAPSTDVAGGLAYQLNGNIPVQGDMSKVHPLAAGMARRSVSKLGNTISINKIQQPQEISQARHPQQGIKPGPGISSSFSQISNKIQLKNLQMKVGTSIRKTQKLKKIYQSSISTLTKKAQQLQTQINKLSREAEYYQIESELLNNIYKADYYMQLNKDWFEVAACRNHDGRHNTVGDQPLDSLKEVSDEENDLSGDFDDDYAEFMRKDCPIPQLNQLKKVSDQYTVTSNKFASLDPSHDFRFSKGSKTYENPSYKNKNILLKQMTSQSLPVAGRFMSGSYNHSILGSNFKNSWYSALYNPKNKANKLSLLMGLKRGSNDTPQNIHMNRIKSSNNQRIYTNPSFLQSNNNDEPNTDRLSQGLGDETKHMTEKQMFLLPHEMISLIISSLEKEEIQQINKLESLRKEEREQKKKNYELIESIKSLSVNKEKLRALIEQQFSLFFMNKVNTMQTTSSFANNTTMKRGSISNINQPLNIKLAFGHSKGKSRTLHRSSSNFKLTNTVESTCHNQSTKPSPWISIQERKQQADQLYMCSLYEKQLLQSIQKQDRMLEEQYKINQEYKQKIIDRNEQENKELKVLEEQVNKCMEQVKEIKLKYKSACQAKGKFIGSHSSMNSAHALPGKNMDSIYQGF